MTRPEQVAKGSVDEANSAVFVSAWPWSARTGCLFLDFHTSPEALMVDTTISPLPGKRCYRE